MKGIVFTEFLEMVEEKFSFDTVDTIIEKANLPSGGAYTAVGTYDHQEIVSLVIELSKESNIPVPDLLRVYGEHLFSKFAEFYPSFFEHVKDGFTFLEGIENHIHKEVLKLYPDAELPTFSTTRKNEKQLEMVYESERSMGHFAFGLMQGCMKHFKEEAEIIMEEKDDEGKEVIFTISKS